MAESFFSQVHNIVSQIPFGCVVSYGQIAEILGTPRSARMVGWAMHSCPDGLPWHRVIKKDGSIPASAPYDYWRSLLEEEDVKFLPDGRVDMKQHRWER